jgi:hypothetical protein
MTMVSRHVMCALTVWPNPFCAAFFLPNPYAPCGAQR